MQRTTLWLSLLLLAACGDDAPVTDPLNVDTLIVGGQVFSGVAGESLTDVDIGIAADRIVFVGDANSHPISATQTLDATDLIVAPGFIDPHTHSFDDLMSDSLNANLNYLTQGVTTVFNGNDGDGPAELCATLAELDAANLGTNTALFVGHGELRMAVMGGDDRAPTTTELQTMRDLVAAAMQCGALGLSTGLYYVPGNFAATAEVVELAKVAAAAGGVYDTHLRDESSYNIGFLAALDEALQIGRSANIAVHISHIKALGVDVWGQSAAAIDLIEQAQAEGLAVTANQYPWRASGTRLRNAVLPREFLAGDSDAYLQRLTDPAEVAAIAPAMAENLRRRGGAESILFVDLENPAINGQTLQQVAMQREQAPLDAAVDIMRGGSTRIASFNMHPDDIAAFMQRDWVMTSSDGTDGHPRKYASFPRKFREYVHEQKLLSVEEFLYRSSSLTAATFGLDDRGRIAPGFVADIVVFDPQRFAPRADFTAWNRLSDGVEYVLVNGQLALAAGEFTGHYAGKVIQRGVAPEE